MWRANASSIWFGRTRKREGRLRPPAIGIAPEALPIFLAPVMMQEKKLDEEIRRER